MKINPDALAKLAALQAAQGVDRILGGQGKDSASPLTGKVATPTPVGKTGAPGATKLPVLPGTTTALTLSPTARQLNSTPPPATLQWAHDVVEALTGLKLPAPTPRVHTRGSSATPPSPAKPGAPPFTAATASAPFSPAGLAAGTAGAAAMPLSPHALSATPSKPYAPPADTALFTAQGTVYAEDGQSFEFSLQLFADRGAQGLDAPPVVPPVLARMLASHPPMPPLALRFTGTPEQLQSAVFEFQVEPSQGNGVGLEPTPTVGVRLLGLLVLDPQMEAVYTMHMAMAAPPDPATVLAAMGFFPGKPAVGKGVWDSAAAGLLCDDARCPHFGETTCPQLHCLRYKPLSSGPGVAP